MTTTFRHSAPKINRNSSCPCNSGKKFKNCHHPANLEKQLKNAIREFSKDYYAHSIVGLHGVLPNQIHVTIDKDYGESLPSTYQVDGIVYDVIISVPSTNEG